ncbi:MAG: hypothetical protein F4117_06520 [Acidimicrobiales bacterium]|nr:hypothetical protein [Acidimicrobiales bacterium]MYB81784.1 hypothetical protein [Acidimicrobiales bacterium]MYD32329.1 hypothetical protein [Acidimicrobiales bacterium]MYI09464.1 hypothetical protein [Acidimicrobiales bacterium]MYI12204.1 hypothetical protein [Acidimicrobiales bacterium]
MSRQPDDEKPQFADLTLRRIENSNERREVVEHTVGVDGFSVTERVEPAFRRRQAMALAKRTARKRPSGGQIEYEYSNSPEARSVSFIVRPRKQASGFGRIDIVPFAVVPAMTVVAALAIPLWVQEGLGDSQEFPTWLTAVISIIVAAALFIVSAALAASAMVAADHDAKWEYRHSIMAIANQMVLYSAFAVGSALLAALLFTNPFGLGLLVAAVGSVVVVLWSAWELSMQLYHYGRYAK